LQANHTLLTIDLPGHGQSAAQPIINLQNIGKQIADALNNAHVGPAVIVGHSMGGTLAGYVALADPKVVRGLVIVDSMFSPYPIQDAGTRAGYANVSKLSVDFVPTSKHWLHWDDRAGFRSSLQKFLKMVEVDAAVAETPAPRGKRNLAKAGR